MSGVRGIPGRTAVLVVGAALGLAACGNAAPRIIGPGVAAPTTRPTVPTTVPVSPPPSTASTAPTASTVPTTTTTLLTPAVTNQIESEIGALLSSLRQADGDLDNPNKGDQ